MESLINWLEDCVPDRAPLSQLTEWEYGVLAGQRLLVEQIKIKFKVELDTTEEEIK